MKSKFGIHLFVISIVLFILFNSDSYANDIRVISGADRIKTSILASEFTESNVLVLANAYSFPDALSSYNIVSSKRAKLVLVDEKTDLTGVLESNNIDTVYLIGGGSTLKGKPIIQVRNKVENVYILGGRDRYETNLLTLKASGYTSVGVSDGRKYPDALSSSCLLKKDSLGLLLVDGSKPYRSEYNVVYTFGGKKSVSQNGGERIHGADRYDTCKKISEKIGVAKNIIFTSGNNFADALSSLNLTNSGDNSAILLSSYLMDKDYYDIVKASKKKYSNINTYIVGGKLKIDNTKNNDEAKLTKNDASTENPKKNKENISSSEDTKKSDVVNTNKNEKHVYRYVVPDEWKLNEISNFYSDKELTEKEINDKAPNGYRILDINEKINETAYKMRYEKEVGVAENRTSGNLKRDEESTLYGHVVLVTNGEDYFYDDSDLYNMYRNMIFKNEYPVSNRFFIKKEVKRDENWEKIEGIYNLITYDKSYYKNSFPLKTDKGHILYLGYRYSDIDVMGYNTDSDNRFDILKNKNVHSAVNKMLKETFDENKYRYACNIIKYVNKLNYYDFYKNISGLTTNIFPYNKYSGACDNEKALMLYFGLNRLGLENIYDKDNKRLSGIYSYNSHRRNYVIRIKINNEWKSFIVENCSREINKNSLSEKYSSWKDIKDEEIIFTYPNDIIEKMEYYGDFNMLNKKAEENLRFYREMSN